MISVWYNIVASLFVTVMLCLHGIDIYVLLVIFFMWVLINVMLYFNETDASYLYYIRLNTVFGMVNAKSYIFPYTNIKNK